MTRFDVIWLTRWIAAHAAAIASVVGVGVRLERRAERRRRAARHTRTALMPRVGTVPIQTTPPLALPRAWSGWNPIGARRQPPPPPRLLIHTCPPVARWQPWVAEAGVHRPPVDWAHRQLNRILTAAKTATAAQPVLFEVTR